MEIGVLPSGDPGVFRSLLLPHAADALSEKEPVTALGLTENGLALGAIAGYLEQGRFLISSLYVSPEHRRRGGGRLLVETLADLASRFCAGMEISFTVTRDEHTTLPPFLSALHFRQESDGGRNIYKTTLGTVAQCSFFSGSGTTFGTPLSAWSSGMLSIAEKTALMQGAPLPEGGLGGEHVEREISVAHFQGGKPQAYVVLERAVSGGLKLSAAWSDARDAAVLPCLLRTSFARAQEKYPPETPLTVQAINPSSAAFIRALIPDAEAISQTWLRNLEH